MNDTLRTGDENLLADLRRATRARARTNNQNPKTNDHLCPMHNLPYLDGRHGCERCLALFAPQGNSTSWKRGDNVIRANGYTHEERAMLRDPSMSDAEISRKTGRSLVAIAEKRKRMRRQTGDAHDAVLQRAWDAIRRHGGER